MVTSKEQVQMSFVFREIAEQVPMCAAAVGMAAQGASVDLADVADRLSQASRDLSKLSIGLIAAGVIVSTAQKNGDALDTRRLAALDTPDTRRLLEVLELAQEIAERVDAERGFAVDEDLPLLPGESRGTDLAESISVLALRLRREVGGAQSPHE